MIGAQCDTCRKFSPSQAPAGWFVLGRIDPSPYSGLLSMLSGSHTPSQSEGPATFCSAQCVADYACVLAATGTAGSPS